MKIFRLIASIVLIISVFTVVVLAIVKMPNRTCSKLEVNVHTQNESVMLTQNDVEKMLAKADIETVGKKMKDVDLASITSLLKANPYVQEINFVHFAGTKLVIDYTLRTALLHVYTNDGDEYFLDPEGALMPYTLKMTDFLAIANGSIHQHYKKGATANKELTPVLELAKLIDQDSFLKSQFRQIYRNANNQLELVSTIGNQIVLFGNTDNAEEKLENLRHVYQQGIPRKGFDQYAQLDVRFKNRIIAQHR